MEALSLAALFTAAGAIAAAAVVRQLVELLKAVIPPLAARVSGAAQAFVASAVLYGLAYASVGPFTPDAAFVAFLSWLGCAVGAVGIDSAIGHVTGSTEAKVTARIADAYNTGHEDGAEQKAVLATFQRAAGPLPGIDRAPGGTA